MREIHYEIWKKYLPLKYAQKIFNKDKKHSNIVLCTKHQTQKYRVERFFKPISRLV